MWKDELGNLAIYNYVNGSNTQFCTYVADQFQSMHMNLLHGYC